jgi:hypothetical protein
VANRPFLFFPPPGESTRARLSGRGPQFRRPSRTQQRDRLQTKFQQIVESFQAILPTIAGADPEQVIVLEAIVDVGKVADAAARIPGLEWLAERDLDDVAPGDGFEEVGDPARRLPQRLYALFTNQAGMNQLLGLWQQWTNDTKLRRGFGPFSALFTHLRDIRRWGPDDRVAETGILEAWREEIAVKGMQGTMRFEAELWFRAAEPKRLQAFSDLQAIVQEAGGQILDTATIPEILYSAALVEMPAAAIQETINRITGRDYSRLLSSEGVMSFRPQAQSRFSLLPMDAIGFDFGVLAQEAQPAGGSVVAILDGVPLQNHSALAGRVVLDDPDGHAALYENSQRHHGTAMASLVLHGDLNQRGPALRSPVYVRPILHPAPFGSDEITPPGKLLVDVLHRAFRRMFETQEGNPPAAPSVRIVNLSIGDRGRPFDRELSPLARLLDWVTWHYRILVIVSIGNCPSDIVIEATESGWRELSPVALTKQVIRAIKNEQFRRRPLSPAEGVNCLSVGAVHVDACEAFILGQRVDLLDGTRLPSPLCTMASGFRRATKPEVLLPGGRQLYMPPLTSAEVPARFAVTEATSAPGHMTAAPGLAPLELGRVRYCCGSSNAAALASRSAALAFEGLVSGDIPTDCEALEPTYTGVVLKTLLVHGASWGNAGEFLEETFQDVIGDWRERVRILQQFLGYGEVVPERCLTATDQRATVLGWASISEGEGHTYRLPLPPSLSARTDLRRLTTTLGWLTPLNYRDRRYRRAHLYLSVAEDAIGTKTVGLDQKSSQRGTLEHRIFEGNDAEAFLDGSGLTVTVNCREDAGKLDGPIPYGLAVSLEVGADVAIAVYDEVRARIRPQVEIQPSA